MINVFYETCTLITVAVGADDVSQLKELDEEEFRQLCLMVGMASKPFHVKRFQKALGRPSIHIYSQKRLGVSTTSSEPSPALLKTNSGDAGRIFHTVHTPRPIHQLPVHMKISQPQPISSPPTLHTSSHGPNHYQLKQYLQQPKQHKKKIQQHDVTMASIYRTAGNVSPTEKEPPQSISAHVAPSLPLKQLFLPHYLLPDSESKDVSSLVDEFTPIQAELGPCPFKPSDWDERRAELVRRYAAIYGQGNSKRKNEELSLHEENINMAAYQLCLRDPTLLVRRDELLVLSRKAIKDGGYTFQHGLSKTKTTSDTATTSSGTRKQTLEENATINEAASMTPSEIANSLMPVPRNMSREKKLKRVEELEFLIAKNKMRQGVKLAALEKARQANDFSTSHHLQAEIESLGNTLANLQEEYSNMKYRLRRSDRYFEKKTKKTEELDEYLIHGHRPSSATNHPHTPPKRTRVQTSFESIGGNNQLMTAEHTHRSSFYTSASADHTDNARSMDRLSSDNSSTDNPRTSSQTTSRSSPINSHDHFALTTTGNDDDSMTVSLSRTFSKVTASSSSHSRPATSKSPTPSPHSSFSTSHTSHHDTTNNVIPIFSTHYPDSSSMASIDDDPLSSTRSTVIAQVLPHQEDNDGEGSNQGEEPHIDQDADSSDDLSGHEEELSSNQLLANINKLASQAAANLRSLPQF